MKVTFAEGTFFLPRRIVHKKFSVLKSCKTYTELLRISIIIISVDYLFRFYRLRDYLQDDSLWYNQIFDVEQLMCWFSWKRICKFYQTGTDPDLYADVDDCLDDEDILVVEAALERDDSEDIPGVSDDISLGCAPPLDLVTMAPVVNLR